MAQSLCCQLWFKPRARGSRCPGLTITGQSWLVQTSVGRSEGLACAELAFSSRAAQLAAGPVAGGSEVPSNAGCPFLMLEVRGRCWFGRLSGVCSTSRLRTDSWDGTNVTVAGAYREGHEGLAEEPFSEGLFPRLARLQLLPVLFEGRHWASPSSLAGMHCVQCKPEGCVQCPGLPAAPAWLLSGAVTRRSPESPGAVSKPRQCP